MSDRIAPQALERLLKLARALAAAVEKAGGFEALAAAQCDVLRRRLRRHTPGYRSAGIWYIILGLAQVHGFDRAASHDDACVFLARLGKMIDPAPARTGEPTSIFYQTNVAHIVPKLSAGAVAFDEVFGDSVMDLRIPGEDGSPTHSCAAHTRDFKSIAELMEFQEQMVKIMNRAIELLAEDAATCNAKVLVLAETALFCEHTEMPKQTSNGGDHCVPYMFSMPHTEA
jgi:hypothetical protein